MWRYIHTDELYHHGTKGMRWGVRRYQKKDGSLTSAGKKRYTKDGSEKTVEKLNKFFEADTKYGPNRTAFQDRAVLKLYKKYDKSVAKDIKKALKNNDTKAANSMSAGRTFLKLLMDSDFRNMAMSDTAAQANIEVGKDYSYNFTRDNSTGGVKVTVNGHSEVYKYM